jgi:hypothetical protein
MVARLAARLKDVLDKLAVTHWETVNHPYGGRFSQLHYLP